MTAPVPWDKAELHGQLGLVGERLIANVPLCEALKLWLAYEQNRLSVVHEATRASRRDLPSDISNAQTQYDDGFRAGLDYVYDLLDEKRLAAAREHFLNDPEGDESSDG